MLVVVGSSLKMVKFEPTTTYILQKGCFANKQIAMVMTNQHKLV